MALTTQVDTSPLTRAGASPGIFAELGNAFADVGLNLFRATGDRLAEAIRGKTTTPAADATQEISLGGFGDLLRAAGAQFGQGAADGAGSSTTARTGIVLGTGGLVLLAATAIIVALIVRR